MKKFGILTTIFIILLFIQCKSFKKEKPRLIVYISVDQMRADYLSDALYGKYLSENGFKRLMNEGTVFQNCYHDHACTMTGPGHATLGSGAYGHKTGIVGNEFWDEQAAAFNYCVYDSTVSSVDVEQVRKKSSSPHYLSIASLGDELKKKFPESKVYGISLKDRAAILMSGNKADGAFWFNSLNGHFMTSSYYMEQLPEWLKQFNQYNQDFFYRVLKSGWQKRLDKKIYEAFLGRDDRDGESDRGGMTTVFPHHLSSQTDSLNRQFYSNLRFTPFGDELLEHFAKEFIQREKLGKDENVDLFCVSFSSTDYIGHTYGPFSHEMMDQIIVLDSLIGDFISFLDKSIGRDHYILALSADHGVAPLPEHVKTKGIPAGRINSNKVDSLMSAIFKKFDNLNSMPDRKYVRKITSNYVYLTEHGREVFQKHKDELMKIIKRKMTSIEGIRDIYSAEEIDSFDNKNKLLRRIKHAYYKSRSGDFYVLVEPYYFFGYPGSKTGTTHGTPYDYDAHVPFLLYGKGIKHQVLNDTVGTADIAVTLGSLSGIHISHDRDGKEIF